MSNAPKQEAKALATKKASPIDEMIVSVMGLVEKRQAKLANLLPEGSKVERFTEAVRYALASEPSLLKCTQESVVLAVMRAARTGLNPDKEMAAIVKFGDEAVFVPMYKGLIALAKASGLVRDMRAVAVYERDTFEVDEANDEVVHKRFVPRTAKDVRGPLIATYCRTILADGTRRYTVLTLPDIERAKAKSRAGNTGPWGTDFDEMAKKAAIKADAKTLGVAPGDTFVALREALAADHAAETGEVLPELRRVEEELPSLPSGTQRLKSLALERSPELAKATTEPDEEEAAAIRAQEQALAEPGSQG